MSIRAFLDLVAHTSALLRELREPADPVAGEAGEPARTPGARAGLPAPVE